MNLVAVIETNGQHQFYRVTLSPSKPVLVGRAWHSDIIVNDEYIDSSHLQLSVNEEGEIQVSDLCTRNGSTILKRRVADKAPYSLGSSIVIGDSSIIFHDADSDVEPVQKLDSAHVASRIFGSFSWVFAASVVVTATLIGSAHYASAVEATNEVLTEQLLGVCILAVAWCLLASFVGKLFRHRTYLRLHWVLVCFTISALEVTMMLVDLLRFNLDSDVSDTALIYTSSAALILLFAYATMSLCTRIGVTKRLAGAFAFALMPVVFNLITPLLVEEHDRWTYVAAVERMNQPPALFFAEPVTLQEHIRKTGSLFAKLDAEVKAATSNPVSQEELINGSEDIMQFSGIE